MILGRLGGGERLRRPAPPITGPALSARAHDTLAAMSQLQSSPHCSPISDRGRTFDVHIHRLEGESDWVLEIVDEDGTSLCSDDRFADDADALAEARRAIEAGECAPIDPAVGELQATFVRVADCAGLAHRAAYALGYFTAAISLPPQQHRVRVFTEMLDPDAPMADLKNATETLGGLYEALATALEGEHVDLSHLSMQGLADWAQGYMAYVADEPRWASRQSGGDGRGDALGPIVAFAAPGVSEIPEPMRDLTQAHDVLAEAATLGFEMWAQERRVEVQPIQPKREEVEPFRREVRKVGRNEACPCGSGRKYKKCCLGT